MSDNIKIEVSSGNVYQDLDIIDAQEMKIKAGLAGAISQKISDLQLTQNQAAKIMGLAQSKVSQMLNGHFRGISQEKMMICLNKLGQDVQIVITNSKKGIPAHSEVLIAA